MPTLYGIQLLDTEGTAIEPGIGGASYESETPFPIPRKGDFILSMGTEFTVENVVYEYRHEAEPPHRVIAAATIICRPNQE
jgi:hypothetical protein